MHKNITREIYPLPYIKTISISLSSLQQHATTEEKERERESTVVVALSWSLFAPHIIVCFLCACSFWSIFGR